MVPYRSPARCTLPRPAALTVRTVLLQGYQLPLGPGEETNVEFELFFPNNLPPREFYLHLRMVLGEGEQYLASLLFNEVGPRSAGCSRYMLGCMGAQSPPLTCNCRPST